MALSKSQLEELKRAIRTRCEALLQETREDVVRAREETYGALAGPVTDRGDQAAADLLSDLDHAEISRDIREARELEAALARLDDGSFGRCAGCGADIDFERLHAYPVAKRCMPCQRVRERTFVQPGEPSL
jgi:RNA polymerase-binding transcription factor DksA